MSFTVLQRIKQFKATAIRRIVNIYWGGKIKSFVIRTTQMTISLMKKKANRRRSNRSGLMRKNEIVSHLEYEELNYDGCSSLFAATIKCMI